MPLPRGELTFGDHLLAPCLMRSTKKDFPLRIAPILAHFVLDAVEHARDTAMVNEWMLACSH